MRPQEPRRWQSVVCWTEQALLTDLVQEIQKRLTLLLSS